MLGSNRAFDIIGTTYTFSAHSPPHTHLVHTYPASDVVLDEQILALVVEDDMDLLCARTTDVRPKHNVVVRLTVHVLLIQRAREHLEETKVK